jgi:hypothetical protein
MDERLMKSGAHQRFIRMLAGKSYLENPSANPRHPFAKSSTYKNLNY